MKGFSKFYTEYLNSKDWQVTRGKVFAYHGRSCRFCPATENLMCHHLHYDNLGKENPWDLIPVCYRCHMKLHNRTPIENPFQLRLDLPPANDDLLEESA